MFEFPLDIGLTTFLEVSRRLHDRDNSLLILEAGEPYHQGQVEYLNR